MNWAASAMLACACAGLSGARAEILGQVNAPDSHIPAAAPVRLELPSQPGFVGPTDGAPIPPPLAVQTPPAPPARIASANELTIALTNPPVAKTNEHGEISALPPKRVAPAVVNTTREVAAEQLGKARERLEMARHIRAVRQARDAEPILVELLAEGMPESIQQAALLELAAVAQDEINPGRAQQIYAQFINRWPNDLRIPEVLLRQGELFRQLGLNTMALAKFYAVMTSALVLKNDQFEYYASLVQRAQTEIAETHYQMGKYADAAECLTRLLKQETSPLNRAQILYKLVRSQMAMGHFDEAVASGLDYLSRYTNAPERPEVQFYLANAMKQLGRDNEALQHVLTLLSEQRARANERPEVWAYWQQRTGNVIANQLYREGDFTKALDIYTSLAQLDSSPQWQLPVSYQIGMTYERLMQPQKATEIYTGILSREQQLSTNAPPSLKAVFDMARWRIKFIEWQEKAEAMNRSLQSPMNTPATATTADPLASLPQSRPALP